MAKNKVEIDVKVDDKGTTKKVGLGAKKAAEGLDKTAKSAQTADRNLKGAAQTSANGTKNFSKMAQGISGGLVPAYATLAAQIFAVSAAFQFLKNASEIRSLIQGQEALGATTGVAYKTITNSIREATDSQLSYAEAARAAAIGTASGLNPTQLNKIGEAAKNASFALGRDLTDSFNRLVRGITKAEPELLDELGITLRLKTATEEYANAIKKPVAELTQFERSQAVANEVLGQAEQKFGAIQKIMSPSASSLNRFLTSFDSLINTIKTGTISALVPIFDFLADKTLALTAALTLFAIPIVKSILPSFDDWGEKAEKTFNAQTTKLAELDKSYDKLRSNIKNLNATQDEALDLNRKQGSQVFKDLKIDTSKASSSGFKASDFLTGGATSKKAQANADRVLKNAEAQLRKSSAVQTGILKGANKQQVADLRRSYRERVGIITKYEKQHASLYTRLNLHVKGYVLKTKVALASLQKFTSKASKVMAGALNKAFAVAGWVGIILLAVDAFKALYEVLFPISEETKKAQEAVDNFITSQKTLNEELERTAKVQTMTGLQTIQERVIAVGNAFQSADLFAKFKELEALKELDTEKYSEALKEFDNTLITLGKLDPEFDKLRQNLDLSNVSEKARDGLLQVGNGLITSSVAAQQLTDSIRTVFAELNKLTGSGGGVDPTLALRQSLNAAGGNLSSTITGTEKQITNLKNRVSPAVEAARKQLQTLKDTGVAEFGGGRTSSRIAEKELQIAQQRAKLLELELKDREAVAEELTAAEKALSKLKKEQNFINALSAEFEKRSASLTKRQTQINTLKQKEASLQTLGISYTEKLQNIEAKRAGARAELLGSEQKLELAASRLNAAYAENSDATDQQKEDAQASFAAAVVEYGVQKDKFSLSQKQQDNNKVTLDIQRQITIENTKQLNAQRQLLANQQRLTISGTTAASPLEAGLIQRAQKQLELDGAIAAKKSELAKAQSNFFSAETQGNEEAKQQALQKIMLQAQELQGLKNNLMLFEKAGELSVIGLQRDTEMLRLKKETLSLNPAAQAANEFILQQQLQGVSLSHEQKKAIYDQKLAQQELNLQIEAQEGLYSTLESGFTNAFTGIITGTQTVKQAFANLAKSVLEYIAQMIVKMLVFRALSSFFGPSFGGGGVPTNINTMSGFTNSGAVGQGVGTLYGRTGGMFEKVPGYATGGIAKGREAGYPAILHGTEAVVPLPNGKSIPVEMQKGGQQMNNVTVNVSMDGGGNGQQNSQSNGQQGANLGAAIATAVQKELQNQKRSGGILNPYGVA